MAPWAKGLEGLDLGEGRSIWIVLAYQKNFFNNDFLFYIMMYYKRIHAHYRKSRKIGRKIIALLAKAIFINIAVNEH